MQNKILSHISKKNFNIVSRLFLFWLQSFQKVPIKPHKKLLKIKNGYLSMENIIASANFLRKLQKSAPKKVDTIENSLVSVKA